MKIGDKVRFLNSVGGGVVRGFKDKNMVMVEDESGFEFPVFLSECVVVGDSDMQVHSSNKPKAPAPAAQTPAPASRPKPEEVKIEETPEGERLNVFLAYLPVDAKRLAESGYEAYLINESNYYLSFTYMNRQNGSWSSRYHGEIEPNTKIFLEEFPKEDLNDLERVCLQFIAYKKDKPFTLKNAVSVELHPDTVKFYKLHCFLDNDFFEEGALVYPVVRNDVPERELLVSAAELQEAMTQKAREDRRAPQVIVRKKKEAEPVLEVDLHITSLLDSTAGMSNGDILNFQLDRFHEVLRQQAGNKGQKIVFIHGKGNGVLRAAVEKELKTKYKQYTYQDASFREYGFGATMVTIK
ncbi:DUF2027 domain-containing protein [Parabacteroides sp. Marseille-P3160]|uniref:DUF2027 domain-containing protein n=1 Tax=Parabacteroides sp. Marseille-P3160 TaxID=1917887 RepID=UPI0009B9BD0F|nr:DUF2027 domain-containing protein [Parabacteroides sp. Marseille-P3160]